MGLARTRFKTKVRAKRRSQKYSLRFFFGVAFIVSGLIMIITSMVLSFIR